MGRRDVLFTDRVGTRPRRGAGQGEEGPSRPRQSRPGAKGQRCREAGQPRAAGRPRGHGLAGLESDHAVGDFPHGAIAARGRQAGIGQAVPEETPRCEAR